MNVKQRNFLANVTNAAGAAAMVAALSGQTLNREQRRAAKLPAGATMADHLLTPPENNTVWDDVNAHAMRAQQLLSSARAMFPLLDSELLISKVDNLPHLLRTAGVLATDMEQFKGFFDGLRGHHTGKTGSSTSPDEHLLAIQLFNDYTTFMQQFEANVRPMILAVAEILQVAQQKLNLEQPEEAQRLTQAVSDHIVNKMGINIVYQEPAMTPEQDPNVITDVVVKESATH